MRRRSVTLFFYDFGFGLPALVVAMTTAIVRSTSNGMSIRVISWAGIWGANVLAFTSTDVGTLIASFTALSLGAIGIYARWRQEKKRLDIEDRTRDLAAQMRSDEELQAHKLRLQKEWEAQNKESLSAQIEAFRQQMERMNADMQAKQAEAAESVGRARKNLHDLRDELNADILRHIEENERLNQEIVRLNQHLDEIRRQNDDLLAQNLRLTRQNAELVRKADVVADRTEKNAAKIEKLAAGGSSDEIDAAPTG